MSQSFLESIPPAERNFYNAESVAKIKRDFNELISDKWSRKGMNDPTVEHDIGSKIYPWDNYASSRMAGETASERLWRVHSRPLEASPTPLPRMYVYHRSTWK